MITRDDGLAYFIILIDCCLRYFHLAYLREEALNEWLVFFNTEAARHILVAVALLFIYNPLGSVAKKIVWVWGGWLTLDFFEQTMDANRGAQIWELGLFILISSLIVHVSYRKSKRKV